MSRFIITGGAGFIGSNLARVILALGHEVKIIDDLSTGRLSNLDHIESELEFRKIDIRFFELLEKEFHGYDYILHQAALPSVARSVADPYGSLEVNILGTVNVLKAGLKAGIKRVVMASSSSVYGDSDKLPKHEDDPVNPKSPYALSKYSAEKISMQFNKLYGLETVALRYFNVFGPFQNPDSQYSAVIPLFIKAVLNDDPVTIFGDGKQSRDFTYIDNVVQANLNAATEPGASGRFFNIACGSRHSLLDMVSYLSEISGKQIEPRFSESRPGDVKHSQADIKLAEEFLNYSPNITFKQGLKKTFDWYKQESR